MDTMNQDKNDETTAVPAKPDHSIATTSPPSQQEQKEATIIRRLMAEAQNILAQVDESFMKQDEGPREYPTFDASELVRGPLLGVGGFGLVFAVKKFELKESKPGNSDKLADNAKTKSMEIPATESAGKQQETERDSFHDHQDEDGDSDSRGSISMPLPYLDTGIFRPMTVLSMSDEKYSASRADSRAPLPHALEESDENKAPALALNSKTVRSCIQSEKQLTDGFSNQLADASKDHSDGHSTEHSSDNSTSGIIPHDESHYAIQSARTFMATRTSRFAFKRLHPDLGAVERVRGMIDLALEVKYLSVLWHPNIVKMRGYAEGPILEPNFFIILDRLIEILDAKLKYWTQMENSFRGCLFECGGNKQRSKELLVERLIVAYDLAAAFSYIHQKKLVYRDIKPENIGFDVRGDVKIFDFGLSKSLSPSLKAKGRDGNEVYGYRLTARTGSVPYMAPEVADRLPYDNRCDVFSFSILLWEILSLKPAFQYYSRREFFARVVRDRQRLLIPRKWPPLTRLAVKEAWQHDPQTRPDMKRVASLLRGDLNELSSDPAVMHRTAHMMDRSCDFHEV